MNDIPVLNVEEGTLPEAWEKALLEAWRKGIEIRTEYDKPGDPLSKECTMIIVVTDPFKEPRIHRWFPAGLENFETYRQEVVYGIHDDRVGEGRWPYSYHERLFSYDGMVKQMDFVIEKLCDVPYTRRAQAITWIPAKDTASNEPPCLQRVFFRLFPVGKDNGLILNMNTHWRSRDAFKAAFMNMWALIDLQREIAEQIEQRLKVPVKIGRYMDVSDSFHIYSSDFKEFHHFLKNVYNKPLEERVWTTKFAKPFFEKAREKIVQELAKKKTRGERN